jgi:hypothetical protein
MTLWALTQEDMADDGNGWDAVARHGEAGLSLLGVFSTRERALDVLRYEYEDCLPIENGIAKDQWYSGTYGEGPILSLTRFEIDEEWERLEAMRTK